MYPTAFILRQEKNIPGDFNPVTHGKYQLIIECADKSSLIYRREIFNKNLTSIVMRYHQEFLSQLDPPLMINDQKVYRWHPLFKLDEVADIEEAYLPTPPITGNLLQLRHLMVFYTMYI